MEAGRRGDKLGGQGTEIGKDVREHAKRIMLWVGETAGDVHTSLPSLLVLHLSIIRLLHTS